MGGIGRDVELALREECVCVRVCVCVCVGACLHEFIFVYICVCVCVRERESSSVRHCVCGYVWVGRFAFVWISAECFLSLETYCTSAEVNAGWGVSAEQCQLLFPLVLKHDRDFFFFSTDSSHSQSSQKKEKTAVSEELFLWTEPPSSWIMNILNLHPASSVVVCELWFSYFLFYFEVISSCVMSYFLPLSIADLKHFSINFNNFLLFPCRKIGKMFWFKIRKAHGKKATSRLVSQWHLLDHIRTTQSDIIRC